MITAKKNDTLREQEAYEAAASERNVTWENNHRLILHTAYKIMLEKELWPTKAEIAEVTGLSRKTVYQHYLNMEDGELVPEDFDQFKFMTSKILIMLCNVALDGDVRAMRLALEVAGVLKKGKGAPGL